MSLQEEGKKSSEINANELDILLEKEKIRNKGDVWIKLDKTVRNQLLQEFADKYGKEHSMSSKDLKLLKTFFKTCLDKNKLNKSKDVAYNRENRVITSIPALHFNQVTKNFTLKILDNKRVSTLKSLTPKKHTPKNGSESNNSEISNNSEENITIEKTKEKQD
jgi:hypothetical protein|tara:strand:+ start:2330 stop:2818 length:489 start_codon:yes stop_codon:yes gene_type:complete